MALGDTASLLELQQAADVSKCMRAHKHAVMLRSKLSYAVLAAAILHSLITYDLKLVSPFCVFVVRPLVKERKVKYLL